MANSTKEIQQSPSALDRNTADGPLKLEATAVVFRDGSVEDGGDETDQSSASSNPRDATEEEITALPHVTDKIPFAAWAVIIAGAAERFTYFGLLAPWRKLTIDHVIN